MKTLLLFTFLFITISMCGLCQSGPWNSPLKIAWSSDGISFSNFTIFQDSAGVPSVIRWKGDTLVAAFQWFRLPNPSPTFDRVAVKFSYDNGITWTQPTPIVITSMPGNYQRPFDPALTVFNDSIRIYFSSSDGMPTGGLDSTVNTYSAKSADGINYIFELNPRVDVSTSQVIDPSVIYFNNSWHYLAPIGSPQQGAYHYISPDGKNFTAVPNIPSDNTHNWTGNYMVENTNELRFYGCGGNIWYNSSPNGGTWNGYVPTNVPGGDPSVLKISNNNYLIIYVGQPYNTEISSLKDNIKVKIFPNPAAQKIQLIVPDETIGTSFTIINVIGKKIFTKTIKESHETIDISELNPGVYFIVSEKNIFLPAKIIKENAQ